IIAVPTTTGTAMSRPAILVTGATGFVGGALLAHLVATGHQARGTVRRADQLLAGRALVAVGELSADTDWSQALTGIDVVVHTAARVHPLHDPSSDPAAAYRSVNLDATVALARQAAAAGVRRLVFLSTIKVNGEATSPGKPFRADDPAAPHDDYAASKAAA